MLHVRALLVILSAVVGSQLSAATSTPAPTFPQSTAAALANSSLAPEDVELLRTAVYLSWGVYQDGWNVSTGWYRFASDNLQLKHRIDDSSKNTKGIVVVDPDTNTTYITFRGTQKTSFDNWSTNLDSDKDTYSNAGPNGTTVNVHQGFNEAVTNVLSTVETALNEARAANHRIVFTGHSLGAALASVSMFRTEIQKPNSEQFSPNGPILITFGSPRAGDSAWAKLFKTSRGWRNVNGKDPIPQNPKRIQGFRQVQLTELWTSRGILHVCGKDEDDECSHGQDFIAGSPADHSNYLGFPSIKTMMGPWVQDVAFSDEDCPTGFYKQAPDIFKNDLDKENVCFKTSTTAPASGVIGAYFVTGSTQCNSTDQTRELDTDVDYKMCLQMGSDTTEIWRAASLIQGTRFEPCPLWEFGWQKIDFNLNTEASDSPSYIVFNRLGDPSTYVPGTCKGEDLPRDWTLIIVLSCAGAVVILLIVFRRVIFRSCCNCRLVAQNQVKKGVQKLTNNDADSNKVKFDSAETASDVEAGVELQAVTASA